MQDISESSDTDTSKREQLENDLQSMHTERIALHHRNFVRSLWALVASVVVLAGIGTAIVVTRTQASNATSAAAQKKIKQLLTDNSAAKDQRRVVSSFGFTVPYDSSLYDARGYVVTSPQGATKISGESFDNADLKQPRNYAIVKLMPKQDTSNTQGVISLRSPSMSILTNRFGNYWDARKNANPGKPLIDLLVADQTTQLKQDGGTVTTKKLTIGGYDYVELDSVKTNTVLGVTTKRTGVTYVTVQNDRPYWIDFDGDFTDTSKLATYLATIQDITYQKLAPGTLGAHASATLASVALPDGTANVPNVLDNDTLLSVVALNQIATVRVGVIYCADVKLTAANGASATLPGTCAAGLGSGSLISSDGYVSTNGHVVNYKDQATMVSGLIMYGSSESSLKAYLQFLVDAGYAPADTVNGLYSKVIQQDYSALDAIVQLSSPAQIEYNKEKYDIAIQTSNQPMDITSKNGMLAWKSNPTIKQAKLIDYDVDPRAHTLDITSQHTDVAILKISQGDYPVIRLSTLMGVQDRDEVTAIGYPAFVDGGGIGKAQTVPSVTQGRVRDSAQDGGGHTLLVTTAQIASGNSGGPALNTDGRQVGLNTYSVDGGGCGDASKCFSNGGIVRDAADLGAMLRKNNILLKTDGEVAQLWRTAIQSFEAGDYSQARSNLRDFTQKYPDNYLASAFLKIAEAQSHNETDTKSTQGDMTVTIILGIFFMIVLAGTIVIAVCVVKYQKQKKQAVAAAAMALPPAPLGL